MPCPSSAPSPPKPQGVYCTQSLTHSLELKFLQHQSLIHNKDHLTVLDSGCVAPASKQHRNFSDNSEPIANFRPIRTYLPRMLTYSYTPAILADDAQAILRR